MDERQPPAHQVTLLWAAVWFIAACIVGVLAGLAFYSFEVVDLDAQNRLLSIIVIGEILLYFIVLLIPGRRVVPPGRTVLTVLGAMMARAGLAAAVSQIVVMQYAQDTAFSEMWANFYSTFWPAALMHIGLIAVYLWLIRTALEVPQPASEREEGDRNFADHLEEFRVPEQPEDENARERQEELLSALMEEPDEPVDWPGEVIAEAQQERVKDEGEKQPPSEADRQGEEGESTDTMPATPALLADETGTQEAAETDREPEGEQPPQVTEETQVETEGPEAALEKEPEAAEEEIGGEPTPQAAEGEKGQPPEPSTEAEAPDQPSVTTGEAEEDQAPVEGRSMPADITSEQASMIEQAVTDLPDMALNIATSPSDRCYALLGDALSEADQAELTEALDVLYATHRLVGDALDAGVPKSLSIMTPGGVLLVGASGRGGAGVALFNEDQMKIGRVNLLANKVASAASDMPLDNPYDPGLSPATECVHDADRTETLQRASGMDDLRTYSCNEHEIALAGAVAHPENLAPAIAALAMAAGEVVGMLPAGEASRMLVEYTRGGAVIASCGERPTLVVTVTGPDGTMGAANVRARNICEAIEEG